MSLIRPRLEYATPVWDPNCQNLHQAIYKIGPTCTYQELLTNSKLQTLIDRRLSLNLSYLFQVLNGSFIFPKCPLSLHQIRNSDSQLLERPVTQTNVYKYSYFPMLFPCGIIYLHLFITVHHYPPLSTTYTNTLCHNY